MRSRPRLRSVLGAMPRPAGAVRAARPAGALRAGAAAHRASTAIVVLTALVLALAGIAALLARAAG